MGLREDLVVVNWNFNYRKASLKWFAERRHSQVIAGFYDVSPMQIRTWMEDARKVPNVEGAMYTTWKANYEHLEAFAAYAWGGAPLSV